ncbi:MAG: trypsin-like peptidase domain-containing protein [Actinomycetota bacterium]|nr:trypsin-like peptidase domain-containing protein [Actinomycetota bacterium]
MKRVLAIAFAAAVVGGAAGAAIGIALDEGDAAASAGQQTAVAAATPVEAGRGLTSEQIYKDDGPGVVVITDTQTQEVQPTPFSPAQKQQVEALGSGFVIDDQGDIVTNDHVVQGSTGIRVGFSNGATYPATVVGTDPSTDIAVVRVDAPSSALHPLTFANSNTVQVGDPVYAIGNPFGLDRTMTSGIVSALGRDIQAPNGLTIPDAIQTDAAINHGNSGGPLIDRFGRVVGINSQIQGGTVNANVGVGFAISSNTAKSISDQLIAHGQVQHAWLGVEVETIDPSAAGSVPGMPSRGVAVVRVVNGSPAAAAGLRPATREVTVNGVSVPVGGDVIVRVDGKPVQTSTELGDVIAQHKPGDKLPLEVVRDGKSRTVDATLASVPNNS